MQQRRLWMNGCIYGVCSFTAVLGLKLETCERLWENDGRHDRDARSPLGQRFLVKNGDRFFLFNERGDLIIAKLSRRLRGNQAAPLD